MTPAVAKKLAAVKQPPTVDTEGACDIVEELEGQRPAEETVRRWPLRYKLIGRVRRYEVDDVIAHCLGCQDSHTAAGASASAAVSLGSVPRAGGDAHRGLLVALTDEVALDFASLDEIARLAALATSYWRSVELAAERGDALTLVVHCKQLAAVTREAFAIVKTLGETNVAA